MKSILVLFASCILTATAFTPITSSPPKSQDKAARPEDAGNRRQAMAYSSSVVHQVGNNPTAQSFVQVEIAKDKVARQVSSPEIYTAKASAASFAKQPYPKTVQDYAKDSGKQQKSQSFNVGYSIGFHEDAVSKPKLSHAILENAEIITGHHKAAQKPLNLNLAPKDFVSSAYSEYSGQKYSSPSSFDYGQYNQNQHQHQHQQQQQPQQAETVTSYHSAIEGGNQWKTISPNVEISTAVEQRTPQVFETQTESSSLQSSPTQAYQQHSTAFNHDYALGNSQGFDYSNAVDFGQFAASGSQVQQQLAQAPKVHFDTKALEDFYTKLKPLELNWPGHMSDVTLPSTKPQAVTIHLKNNDNLKSSASSPIKVHDNNFGVDMSLLKPTPLLANINNFKSQVPIFDVQNLHTSSSQFAAYGQQPRYQTFGPKYQFKNYEQDGSESGKQYLSRKPPLPAQSAQAYATSFFQNQPQFQQRPVAALGQGQLQHFAASGFREQRRAPGLEKFALKKDFQVRQPRFESFGPKKENIYSEASSKSYRTILSPYTEQVEGLRPPPLHRTNP